MARESDEQRTNRDAVGSDAAGREPATGGGHYGAGGGRDAAGHPLEIDRSASSAEGPKPQPFAGASYGAGGGLAGAHGAEDIRTDIESTTDESTDDERGSQGTRTS